MSDLLRGDTDLKKDKPGPDWQTIHQRLDHIAGSLEQLVEAASGAEQQRNDLHQDLGLTVSNGLVPSHETVRLLRSVRVLLVVVCLLLLGLLITR